MSMDVIHVAPGLMPVRGGAYSETMPFLGHDLPLPPGDWSLLSFNVQRDGDSLELLQVVMERHTGSTAAGLFFAGGQPAGHRLPISGLTAVCQESDVIENDIRAADPAGEQDCLNVNFASMPLFRSGVSALAAGRSGAMQPEAALWFRAFAQLDQRNLVVPQTMLVGRLSVVRHGDATLTTILSDPDAAGVKPDPTPSRATNGWARFNLDKDPAKRAFVQRIRAETEAYRVRLLDALDRELKVPDGPKLRTASADAV